MILPLGGGAGSCEPTSLPPAVALAKTYLLPMKLSPLPPDGLSDACKLHEGQVAWDCVCELRAEYFPPDLFSKTFVALHHLGALRTYYASGGLLQDSNQTMPLVFLFDRVKYALTLRVHGERQSKGELHDHLKTAAGMVKGVFRQFKGLVGTVPDEFQFTDAHDDINTKVRFIECRDNPSSRNT